MHEKVNNYKPSVMKGYYHHGSFGSCFSFGNKPLYSMVNDKSVGVYIKKNNDNDVRKKPIDVKAKEVEKLCSNIITDGVNSLTSIIPDIKYLLIIIIFFGRMFTHDIWSRRFTRALRDVYVCRCVYI